MQFGKGLSGFFLEPSSPFMLPRPHEERSVRAVSTRKPALKSTFYSVWANQQKVGLL